MLNRSISLLAHSPISGSLLSLLERLDAPRPNHLRVLTYHRVENPASFGDQMRYLARRYPVVSAQEVLAAFERRTVLAPGAILITFDDAYTNFAEVAWPVLRGLNLPVTLFVPTAFPDHPERVFWWDRLEAAMNQTQRRDELQTQIGRLPLATTSQRRAALRQLKRQISRMPHDEALVFAEWICNELVRDGMAPTVNPVLGWDALRRLASEGVTLGAHTRTHPLMNQVTPEEAVQEAAGSLHDLTREISTVLPIFAYPGGQFSEAVVEDLRQAGFALAFTTIRGTNILPAADPLRLRRINIGHRATLPVLRTRLLHASMILNRFRPLTKTGPRTVGSLLKHSS